MAPASAGIVALLAAVNGAARLRRVPHQRFPVPDRRHASVVVLTWDGRHLLEQTLPPLLEALEADDSEHELIVVDNGSADGTPEWIRESYPQIRLVALSENGGFSVGCNAGAQAARHDVVVFLNNDMIVDRGFLRPLLRCFDHPAVFAAASQILRWDSEKMREETGRTEGRLVAGLLWVGHSSAAALPGPVSAFYAGGGSSAFDRRKFLALGGFDELFRPIYVEDVDISYRAWKRGWVTLYQPASLVWHKHRATTGQRFDPDYIRRLVCANNLLFTWRNVSDPSILVQHCASLPLAVLTGKGGYDAESFWQAAARLPEVVRGIWRERPREFVSDRAVLERAADPAYHREASEPLVEPDRKGPLNILILAPYFPFPPSHGGAVRMFNLIRELGRRHRVYLVTFMDREEERAGISELERHCAAVTAVLRRPDPLRYNPFGREPMLAAEFADETFRRAVRETLATCSIDVVQAEYTQMAQYLSPSRHSVNVLTQHDVTSVSAYRRLRSARSGLETARGLWRWLQTADWEVRACRTADAVVAVSEEDGRFIRERMGVSHVDCSVPNGADAGFFRPPPGEGERRDLLFVGYFGHAPNPDAVLYFARHVLPLVHRRRPDVGLTVAGKDPPAEVLALARDPRVTVTGYVEDLRPLYHRHAVFVAPIRWGSGTRMKIVEAMAAGIPVISTTLGVEGLQGASGREFLVADEPAGLAEWILLLLERPDIGNAIARRARRLVEEVYDWPIVAGNLERLYRRLLVEKRAPVRLPDATRVPARQGGARGRRTRQASPRAAR